VRVPVEEHVLVMSPPRKGKTAWLAHALMRYPGPAVATSVKDDLFTLTSGVRAARGPVEVFNPEGYGGWPSTLSWNPIAGCESEQVAFRRAEALTHAVSVQGTDDGSFWQAKASQMFVALFHAAALLHGDLRLVARWVFSDDTEAREVLSRHGAQQMAASLLELHNAPAEKTASVFRMVMTNALAFMGDPQLAQSVLPHVGAGFDITQFIHSGGTLYLIATGEQEQSPLAPLFATLVNEIKYQAVLLAQASPGGRLDPPLGLFLDEVTQIAPVPLNKWLASTGGMGIEIFPVIHGEAQLRERWGEHAAQVILDTCGAKMFFPGITDPDTLSMAAKVRVRDVYLPAFGHLAHKLPACWDQHILCLTVLDVASELHSVLYLQATRNQGLLAGQAELLTRLLPALATLMAAEGARCQHTQSGTRPLASPAVPSGHWGQVRAAAAEPGASWPPSSRR
jgi:type IV secretory pathway TraG/TraD family ATPase VirD4